MEIFGKMLFFFLLNVERDNNLRSTLRILKMHSVIFKRAVRLSDESLGWYFKGHGNYPQPHCNCTHNQSYYNGNQTQWHYSYIHTQSHYNGTYIQQHDNGSHTQSHYNGTHIQQHDNGNHTQSHYNGSHIK